MSEHAFTCTPGRCYAACACGCHHPDVWPYWEEPTKSGLKG